MRNKLWYELVHIKYGEIYLSLYLSRQRNLRKGVNIVTLLVSISGILSWKFFEDYAWFAFILIAILQLFILIENQLVRSEAEIDQVSKLRLMYTKYFNKIERLWAEYCSKEIKEDKTLDLFYKMRKSDWERIESLDNKLDIKQHKGLMDKADNQTNKYLNQYHKL